MKTKKGKLFKCKQCSKEYKVKGFLQRHQQYYCTATGEEDPEKQSGKYYCIFCDTEYTCPKSFNLHFAKCLRDYDASQRKQCSSPPRQAVKLHVCSICQKGFSRLGTYKCHLSCHEKKEKRIVKSVIRPVRNDSKDAGITPPNLSKLPRIPRLSERNGLHPDHNFSKPPNAEQIADEEVRLPPEKQLEAERDENLEEPVVRLALTVNNDEIIINEMPKLVIQDVRHVERVEALADSTEGLSMPQLEFHKMYEETSNLNDDYLEQQLLEEMRVTDEDEEGVSSSCKIVPSSDEDDVTIVEEQQANRLAHSSEAITDRVQTSVEKAPVETLLEKISSNTTETVVLSEDENVVIVNESKDDQPERARATVRTVNVQLETISTISLLESKPFACTICNRKFHTENTMRLHYNFHSQNSPNCIRARVSPPAKCSIHKKKDPRCCSQKRPSLESRCTRSKNTRLFECLFCGFSSVNQNALLKHKLHFHRKNFACALCKRTFRTRLTRLLHIKTHKSVAK